MVGGGERALAGSAPGGPPARDPGTAVIPQCPCKRVRGGGCVPEDWELTGYSQRPAVWMR